MRDEEDKYQREEVPAGPLVFMKTGLSAILKILLVLFLVWLWWKGRENRPVEQVEKLLQQQK
jgi:hypothetical protein